MADYNLKAITADTDGPSADTELLFGSPDQSSGTPKPYSFAGLKTWVKSWSDALYLDAASNLSDLADLVTARFNLGVGFGGAKTRFYAYTDCLFADNILRSDFFTPTPSGTGAGVTVVDYGASNAVGVLSLDLGTTTTGRSTLWGASTAGTAAKAITFGRGRARFRAKLNIPVLSNGTDTFTTRMGFLDSQISNAANGAWFRYTHGTNSGKWEAVTRDNSGTETASDTGITAVATIWQEFTIDVNAAGTSAQFLIDNVVVATITTTIPTTAGRATSYGIVGIKSVGTTATAACQVDYIEVQQDLTTAR